MGKESESDSKIYVPEVHGLKARRLGSWEARRPRILDRINPPSSTDGGLRRGKQDRQDLLSHARPAHAGLETQRTQRNPLEIQWHRTPENPKSSSILLRAMSHVEWQAY